MYDFTSEFRVGGSDMSRFSFKGGPEIRNGTLMTYTEQGAYFDGADSVQGREEGTRQLLGKLAEELQNSKYLS